MFVLPSCWLRDLVPRYNCPLSLRGSMACSTACSTVCGLAQQCHIPPYSGCPTNRTRGDELNSKNYKKSVYRSDGWPHLTPYQASPLPYLCTTSQLAIANMIPETRLTRSTNNPGIVDLPKSRRSSSEVAAEKLKKKQTAAAKAKNKREREAQIARVEREIKIAQNEATQSSGGRKGRVKRTFPRETPMSDTDVAKEVSSSRSCPEHSSQLTQFPQGRAPRVFLSRHAEPSPCVKAKS